MGDKITVWIDTLDIASQHLINGEDMSDDLQDLAKWLNENRDPIARIATLESELELAKQSSTLSPEEQMRYWEMESTRTIDQLESRIATLQAQWHELGNEMENETGNMPADREPTVQEVIDQVRLLKSQLAATKEWYDEAYAQRATLQAQANGLAAALEGFMDAATFPAWAGESCRSCPRAYDGGCTDPHDADCSYFVAEQKAQAVLREFRGEGG